MRLTRIAAVLAAALALTGVAAGPAGADLLPPPLPENDPFYQVPAKIKNLPNGTVLRSREIDPVALSVPLPARGWQVLYKTLDCLPWQSW